VNQQHSSDNQMPPHLCYHSTSHHEHRIKLKRRETEK